MINSSHNSSRTSLLIIVFFLVILFIYLIILGPSFGRHLLHHVGCFFLFPNFESLFLASLDLHCFMQAQLPEA